uniref:5'-3' exoribonuclease 2 n=1 Tax=Xiphophorus maculatus TaxID=8083 RepID=A0A3B5QRQ6_XIPMA
MGVPAFFRWLSRKYPSIIVHCVEEKGKECNGVRIPVDTTKPNPNEVEFDNLYLDMNGIIHPCTHPEDKPAPKNEDEMMVAIFEYIDRLFNIVRPRRVLYMAIDGVAPRAKMNQQRSRRFRASKEGAELTEEKNRMREEVIQRGGYLPPEEIKERFDSNCITPVKPHSGRDAFHSDPFVPVQVFLSDASVPGEGEHKIMDFIRRQRAQPNHDPNTHHCLCGADADLIMLGLATHEPNFTIIREEFKPNKPRPCSLCGQTGHEIKDCQGVARQKQGEHDEFAGAMPAAEQEFIFIRLCVLREYLSRELTMASLPFPFDFERSVDDWVFMCFFVGNDFLPHLPSLEIREGAIDRLVSIYKDVVHKTGGYLTQNGFVNLERVELIMQAVGVAEDNIFRKRKEDDVRRRRTEEPSPPRPWAGGTVLSRSTTLATRPTT